MMRAFQVTAFDTPPNLVDIPLPTPRKGEVLVRITACGLNFADMLMSIGKYQDTPKPPFTLGMEACGVVEALGPDTTGPALGTRIAVFGGQGGLAEYAIYPADLCTPLPETMEDADAAAFQVAYGTSHLALTHRARLQAGDTLLVLGAAGGVGLTAVEIGKALGATVIAAARGPEKLAIAKQAGADHLIDTAQDDLRSIVKSLGGADVVYDPVGGDLFKPALRACNPLARYIAIGFASGDVPQIPANHLLVKNIDVIGFYWGAYLGFAPKLLTASMEALYEMHAKGHISPHISHRLPLERAAEGIELLRSRKATGKVVIEL